MRVQVCKRSCLSLSVLVRAGVISSFIKEGSFFIVGLFYIDAKPLFSSYRCFLRPSSPFFVSYRSLVKLADYNYGGFLVLSTSRGLLTHSECLNSRIGGKLAFMLNG